MSSSITLTGTGVKRPGSGAASEHARVEADWLRPCPRPVSSWGRGEATVWARTSPSPVSSIQSQFATIRAQTAVAVMGLRANLLQQSPVPHHDRVIDTSWGETRSSAVTRMTTYLESSEGETCVEYQLEMLLSFDIFYVTLSRSFCIASFLISHSHIFASYRVAAFMDFSFKLIHYWSTFILSR